jgi:hypothetical protein
VRSRLGLVTLVALVLVAAVACTASSAGRRASPAPASTAAPHSTHVTVAAPAAKLAPEQLRGRFEQLLGQHTVIAVRLMRSVVAAAPDLRQAAVASLQENSHALHEIVASAYGSAQADRFNQLWEDHIADLFSYANGVANHDESAKQTARTALMAYCDDHGAWLAAASKGRVKASDANAGVRMHVEELIKQLDVYAAGNYDQAYQIEREAYEHMFTAGTTLAKGSLTPEVAVGLDAAPQQLRSAFSMLLGEHMEMVVDAQRATFAGPAEFKAAAAQVNANTTALTKAMGTIAGARKGEEFQTAWASHVEGLMGYTAAVAGKDDAAKAAAEQKMNTAVVSLARYFSGVVKDKRAFVPLTGAITQHDTHLSNQVNAYAVKDYTQAQAMEQEGYQQMLGVADTLVDAIQRTVQKEQPVGGSQTGGGGTAHQSR